MKKIIRFIVRALFVYSIRKLLKGSVPKDKLPGYFTNIKFENDEVYYSYIKDLIMNYRPSDKFIVENTDKYMSCFLRSKWLNPGTIGIMFLSETMGNYYLTECIICTLSSGNYKCLGDVLKLYFPALSPMYNIESVVWRTICAKESILKYITVEDLIEYPEYIEWNLIFTFRLFSLEELKRIDISIPELLSNKYCDLIVKNQPEVVFNKDYQNFILDKLNYSNIDREIFIKIKNKHYRNYNHRSGYFIFYQYKENSSCSGFLDITT